MDNENYNELLTVSEVGKYLRIPLKSVYYLTQTGKIKGIKVGKHWRYHLKDIKCYYQNGTKRSAISGEIIITSVETQNITEKRTFPRINCNIRCLYEVVIPELKELSSTGSIRNISGNGVFLYGLQGNLENIFAGDPISLKFELNTKSGKRINLNVPGRVVRKVNEGIGIKFRDIDKYYRDLLIRYAG